uniref:Uncharacterized protein n=1 Tax=Lepeophtheirus salmonis TaxID=72036 RepID=A0A0K2V1M7_LEPSM
MQTGGRKRIRHTCYLMASSFNILTKMSPKGKCHLQNAALSDLSPSCSGDVVLSNMRTSHPSSRCFWLVNKNVFGLALSPGCLVISYSPMLTASVLSPASNCQVFHSIGDN